MKYDEISIAQCECMPNEEHNVVVTRRVRGRRKRTKEAQEKKTGLLDFVILQTGIAIGILLVFLSINLIGTDINARVTETVSNIIGYVSGTQAALPTWNVTL